MLTLLDHLVVLVLALLVPAYAGIVERRSLHRTMAEDRPGGRIRHYRWTMVQEWAVTTAVVALWYWTGRTWEDMGLVGTAGAGFWIGAAAGLAVVAAIVLQQRLAARTDERRRQALAQIEHVAPFLPRNPRELRSFAALALTAGVCEEIVYRGYLIWYATQFLGDGAVATAAAVCLAALAFGAGHLYQGVPAAGGVTIAGLGAGGLYLLSGSLWIPMAVHAALDLNGGWLFWTLRRRVSGAAMEAVIRT